MIFNDLEKVKKLKTFFWLANYFDHIFHGQSSGTF